MESIPGKQERWQRADLSGIGEKETKQIDLGDRSCLLVDSTEARGRRNKNDLFVLKQVLFGLAIQALV